MLTYIVGSHEFNCNSQSTLALRLLSLTEKLVVVFITISIDIYNLYTRLNIIFLQYILQVEIQLNTITYLINVLIASLLVVYHF